MQIPKVLLANDDPASLYALESLPLDAAEQHLYQLTAEAIHSHRRSARVFIIFITARYAAKVAVFVGMCGKNIQLRLKSDGLARLNQDLRVRRLPDLERANAEMEQEIQQRKLAEQRLEHAVATADRGGVGFALLFLDLDKFKRINDNYGHEAGDELLRRVAARLTAAVRVARKIEPACATAFDLGGYRLKLAASIGIAPYPQDGANAQALIKTADTAMYHAKAQTAAPVQFFHEALNVREREREQWTLEPRYQPRTDIASGRTIGAVGGEPLCVWPNLATRHRHPNLPQVLLPSLRRYRPAPDSIGIELSEKLLLGAAGRRPDRTYRNQ